MTEIRIAPELWSTSILPQGILQQWRRPSGAFVWAGEPIACVRIEDNLHEVIAPTSGRLTTDMKPNSVIEPGMVIGRLDPP